jgi:hypothetical protein
MDADMVTEERALSAAMVLLSTRAILVKDL